MASTCKDCGAAEVRVHIGDVSLCDRCADRRVARLMGLPELGAPPPPFVLTGPDGTGHRMQPRPWRAPTGIVIELEETDVPVGEGFQFSILGPPDADVGELLAQLRTHAEAEVARRYLEPNPHRRGWLLAGEEVAGRLVWSEGREAGEPYDVVVDGRTLSWEELGRALEPFEGWRFRLVIEDRSLDVRPDAEVVALPPQQRPSASVPGEVAASAEATIDDVLTEFLAAQEQRLAARTFANYLAVVDLLRHCLNGYGHQYLDDDERVRFEQAFEGGDEEAFVHLFGPDKIADVLGEFLDYFMVRKVMGGEELLRAAGTVTKKLGKWMAANATWTPRRPARPSSEARVPPGICPEPSACPGCWTSRRSAPTGTTNPMPKTMSWRITSRSNGWSPASCGSPVASARSTSTRLRAHSPALAGRCTSSCPAQLAAGRFSKRGPCTRRRAPGGSTSEPAAITECTGLCRYRAPVLGPARPRRHSRLDGRSRGRQDRLMVLNGKTVPTQPATTARTVLRVF